MGTRPPSFRHTPYKTPDQTSIKINKSLVLENSKTYANFVVGVEREGGRGGISEISEIPRRKQIAGGGDSHIVSANPT